MVHPQETIPEVVETPDLGGDLRALFRGHDNLAMVGLEDESPEGDGTDKHDSVHENIQEMYV